MLEAVSWTFPSIFRWLENAWLSYTGFPVPTSPNAQVRLYQLMKSLKWSMLFMELWEILVHLLQALRVFQHQSTANSELHFVSECVYSKTAQLTLKFQQLWAQSSLKFVDLKLIYALNSCMTAGSFLNCFVQVQLNKEWKGDSGITQNQVHCQASQWAVWKL